MINNLPILGKTIVKFDAFEIGSSSVTIHCDDGTIFDMYHEQDCCEYVSIEDICGDIQNLIGSPLVVAQEVSNENDLGPKSEWDDSYTWTFYKFATIKGYVDVRWYGSSNGYYSESVHFLERENSPFKDIWNIS